MNKQILSEINRINQLMGVKPLLVEQSVWLNLIKQLIKSGASTVDTVIDDVAELLVAQGKMTRTEADDAARILKTDDGFMSSMRSNYTKNKLDYGLAASADDLIKKKVDDLLLRTGNENVDTFVKKLATVSDTEYEKITKNVISKMYKAGALPNAQKGYDVVVSFWKRKLEEYVDNPYVYLNLEDFERSQIMWAYDYCKRALIVPQTTFTDDMAEEFIEMFKKRFNEEPEIQSLIQRYKDADRIDISEPIISKPSLTSVLDEPKELNAASTKSAFKDIDEVTQESNLIDNTTGIPNSGKVKFIFRWGNRQWSENIINILRGFGRKPESFVTDLNDTLAKINELGKKLDDLNPGDSDYKTIMGEFKTLSKQLKSDMVLLQTPEKMFISVWEDVKKSILGAATEAGVDGNKIISALDNNDKAVSISNFIKYIESVQSEVRISDVYSGYETPLEYLKSWAKGFSDYKNEVEELWKKTGSETGYAGKIIAVATKFLIDGLSVIFKRAANYLTFGTLRYTSTIQKTIALGRFTKLQSIKTMMLLYIEITLISNLIVPQLEFLRDWYISYSEMELYAELEKGLSPVEKYWENMKQRIPGLGNEFEWNPFYNPISPITGEVGLGFRPAPLPEFIAGRLGFVKTVAETDTQIDQNKRRESDLNKELSEKEKEIIKNSDSTNLSKYNKLNDEEKKKVLLDNGYTNLKDFMQMPEIYEPDGLTKEDAEFISKNIRFVPGLPPDYFNILKFTDPDLYADYDKVKESIKTYSQMLSKNPKTKPPQDVQDYMKKLKSKNKIEGYNVLRGGDKDFIILDHDDVKDMKISLNTKSPEGLPLYGTVVWVTPSTDELGPNTKREYHNLKTFIEKYKK